ncbi:MAG: HAD family hydrolase [Candidatus Thermoplasmatota archaeon]
MSVKAILFDAFGTVIHAEPEWESLRAECLTIVHGTWSGRAIPMNRFLVAYEAARAHQHVRAAQGLEEFDFAQRFERTILACGAAPRDASEWGPIAAEKYHRFQQALIHAYDQPAPTLVRLHEAGYKMALVSNYAHVGVLEDALTRLGIRKPFDALIASGEVGFMKPHPAVFDAALRALGERAQDAVMIGDSLANDVIGARKLGMRAIWAPYPRVRPAPYTSEADAVIERLADLPSVIERLG